MVHVNGIDIAFTEAGSGSPVVLIHGLAEDRRSWADVQQRLWGFRTYACDLRGHGQTTAGQGNGTLEQLGADLAGFLEKVTGPAACVGFSLGGTVVLWAAAHRPELVTRAVVAGTSSIVGRVAADYFHQRIAQIEDDLAAFAEALRQDTALQLVMEKGDLDMLTGMRLEAVGEGAGYINAARAMARIREHPLTPFLAAIKCPVDVIGGDKDQFCPRKAAEILCSALPEANYTEIADAGHLMSVDQPEAYAKAIGKALLRRV